MARHIKTNVPRGFFEYVPNIDDNRTDPDPFVIEIRVPQYSEVSAIETAAVTKALVQVLPGAKSDGVDRLLHMQLEVIAACSQGCRNYSFETMDTGEVIEPKTGKELAQHILRASPVEAEQVINDIYNAIRNAGRAKAGALDVSARSPE